MPLARSAHATFGHARTNDQGRLLDDVESIAMIGSYSLDIASGRWVSSKGLDALLGIEAGFDRSVEGWASLIHPDDREAMVAYLATDVLGGGHAFDREYRVVRPSTGEVRSVHGRGTVRLDASGRPQQLFGTIADLTDRRSAEIDRARLALAVEHVSNAVVITDLAGTIEYVNPAFERISGYGREAVVGSNPRILKSGSQTERFYQAMWRQLGRGETWSGRFTNRRPDGAVYQVEATISPIPGSTGGVTGYVGVERDVTAFLAAKSDLAKEFRERAQVAVALARLEPHESAEATAAVLCDELLGLSGIDYAALISFDTPTRAVPLAVGGSEGLPLAAGRLMPAQRASYLYARAALGPWAEALHSSPDDSSFSQRLIEVGIKAIAYAPIRSRERLLGVVAAGTIDDAYARHLIDHLPIVGEFAATACALLAPALEGGQRDVAVRSRIRRVLARRQFKSVFQPIVDLASGDVVGYEALTRFDDGAAPDRMIAEAHSVGLGLDLEVACLTSALEDADGLPKGAWLALNASPVVILRPRGLAELLAGQPRPTVLEITEHVEIADYAAVRAAVAALGPNVSLAVDDAGAGFASLHHIVELKPRFLKLDISLVRSVGRDPTRQAMIAGLIYFAVHAGCVVIAEGIEDSADLDTLRELGVSLGQGYLLGRPGPASESSGVTGHHPQAPSPRRGGRRTDARPEPESRGSPGASSASAAAPG